MRNRFWSISSSVFLAIALSIPQVFGGTSENKGTSAGASLSNSDKLLLKLADQPTTISITPGPMEKERRELLDVIKRAADGGVGVTMYLGLLDEIEDAVRKGASAEVIEPMLNRLTNALKSQLEQRDKTRTRQVEKKSTRAIKPPQIPKGTLTLEQARLFMLSLINLDRTKHKLRPVALDPIACAAGQRHTDEMVIVGYHGHWDLLGRKPDQRYTESGGMHVVGENVCYTGGHNDAGVFKLVKDHLFFKSDLVTPQSLFMGEKPPDDGHKLQILTPEHTHVGIGLSYSEADSGEDRVALTQEFVNKYGDYSKVPTAFDGKPIVVSGSLFPGIQVDSVEFRWEPPPTPMTRLELNNTHSYCVPSKVVEDFLPDVRMKVWMKGNRQQFSTPPIQMNSWKPGLYYILVWATTSSSKHKEVILVSSRTITFFDRAGRAINRQMPCQIGR